MEERVFERGGVRLRALLWPGESERLPVVFLPGFLGPPEAYRAEARALAPHPVAALGLRGSPGCGAPERGWSVEDFLADLVFLLERRAIPPFLLSAYSSNVPLALAYAARHPERVRGLLLIDYPARVPRPGADWVRRMRKARPDLPEAALLGIHAEFGPFDAGPLLSRVRAPVLLLRGNPERGGLLDEGEAEAMRAALPNARVVAFPESGHEVWDPDPGAYLEALKGFVAALEGGR